MSYIGYIVIGSVLVGLIIFVIGSSLGWFDNDDCIG